MWRPVNSHPGFSGVDPVSHLPPKQLLDSQVTEGIERNLPAIHILGTEFFSTYFPVENLGMLTIVAHPYTYELSCDSFPGVGDVALIQLSLALRGMITLDTSSGTQNWDVSHSFIPLTK